MNKMLSGVKKSVRVFRTVHDSVTIRETFIHLLYFHCLMFVLIYSTNIYHRKYHVSMPDTLNTQSKILNVQNLIAQ